MRNGRQLFDVKTMLLQGQVPRYQVVPDAQAPPGARYILDRLRSESISAHLRINDRVLWLTLDADRKILLLFVVGKHELDV